MPLLNSDFLHVIDLKTHSLHVTLELTPRIKPFASRDVEPAQHKQKDNKSFDYFQKSPHLIKIREWKGKFMVS